MDSDSTDNYQLDLPYKPSSVSVYWKKITVPKGLPSLLETFVKETIRENPDDIYKFLTDLTESLLAKRSEEEKAEPGSSNEDAPVLTGVKQVDEESPLLDTTTQAVGKKPEDKEKVVVISERSPSTEASSTDPSESILPLEVAAVTKLQAGYRGYKTRKDLKEARKKRGGDASANENASNAAQPTAESNDENVTSPKEGAPVHEPTEEEVAAAIKLQAGFRGYQTRKELKQEPSSTSRPGFASEVLSQKNADAIQNPFKCPTIPEDFAIPVESSTPSEVSESPLVISIDEVNDEEIAAEIKTPLETIREESFDNSMASSVVGGQAQAGPIVSPTNLELNVTDLLLLSASKTSPSKPLNVDLVSTEEVSAALGDLLNDTEDEDEESSGSDPILVEADNGGTKETSEYHDDSNNNDRDNKNDELRSSSADDLGDNLASGQSCDHQLDHLEESNNLGLSNDDGEPKKCEEIRSISAGDHNEEDPDDRAEVNDENTQNIFEAKGEGVEQEPEVINLSLGERTGKTGDGDQIEFDRKGDDGGDDEDDKNKQSESPNPDGKLEIEEGEINAEKNTPNIANDVELSELPVLQEEVGQQAHETVDRSNCGGENGAEAEEKSESTQLQRSNESALTESSVDREDTDIATPTDFENQEERDFLNLEELKKFGSNFGEGNMEPTINSEEGGNEVATSTVTEGQQEETKQTEVSSESPGESSSSGGGEVMQVEVKQSEAATEVPAPAPAASEEKVPEQNLTSSEPAPTEVPAGEKPAEQAQAPAEAQTSPEVAAPAPVEEKPVEQAHPVAEAQAAPETKLEEKAPEESKAEAEPPKEAQEIASPQPEAAAQTPESSETQTQPAAETQAASESQPPAEAAAGPSLDASQQSPESKPAEEPQAQQPAEAPEVKAEAPQPSPETPAENQEISQPPAEVKAEAQPASEAQPEPTKPEESSEPIQAKEPEQPTGEAQAAPEAPQQVPEEPKPVEPEAKPATEASPPAETKAPESAEPKVEAEAAPIPAPSEELKAPVAEEKPSSPVEEAPKAEPEQAAPVQEAASVAAPEAPKEKDTSQAVPPAEPEQTPAAESPELTKTDASPPPTQEPKSPEPTEASTPAPSDSVPSTNSEQAGGKDEQATPTTAESSGLGKPPSQEEDTPLPPLKPIVRPRLGVTRQVRSLAAAEEENVSEAPTVLRRPKSGPGRSRVRTSKYRSGLVIDNQMSMDEMEKEIEDEMMNNAAVKIQAGFRGFKTRKAISSQYGVSKKGKKEEEKAEACVAAGDVQGESTALNVDETASAAAAAARLSPEKDNSEQAQGGASKPIPPLSSLRSLSFPGSHDVEEIHPVVAFDEGEEDLLLHPEPDVDLDLDPDYINKAAVRIQKNFRGYRVRKAMKRYPTGKENEGRKGPVKSQKLSGLTEDKKGSGQSEIIERLQDNNRDKIEESEQPQKAAAKIQASFRSYKERTKYQRKKQAAITLQANIRGFLTRKRLANLRRRSFQRRRSSGKAFQKELEEAKKVNEAATKIQAVFRGYQVRSKIMPRGTTMITEHDQIVDE